MAQAHLCIDGECRRMKTALMAFGAACSAVFFSSGALFANEGAAAPAQGGPVMLSSSFSPESLERARLKEFAAIVDQASRTDDFVGFAVAVVRRGKVELLKTYGVREFGGSEPITPQTTFRIGSLSKGFASTLAGLALAEGDISLSTPVAQFAPNFALKGGSESRVTVEYVLSHRVGLPPNAYDNLLEEGVAVRDIISRFRKVKPICSVGSCYAYQNVSYDLISSVLSSVYGQPYEDLVADKLFGPLGMSGASVGIEGLTLGEDWARPHVRDRLGESQAEAFGEWRIVPVKDAYYRTPAAGGVNASITDMARWLIAQMGGAPNVISDEVLRQIHAPVVDTPAELRRWTFLRERLREAKYALGWRVYDYAGHTLINHSGTVEGYGAQIAWLPDRDVGIVILSNTRAERVWRLLPVFLDIELGLGPEDWLALKDEDERLDLTFGAAQPGREGGQ